ncbi:hypothetical protein FA13DRAFT_261937 [Coprinellus micaceus]|uniref:Uncharacterized protein n=1 Tax=Coprinellus micaceus TaxID=71717 RepID=A0A4Y7TEH9_COPMI|nr:hypothetical protein FA13DRAFT_261937 [Coprinellus micaceus]
MSASLTTGIPYHIRSSVYSGGYLQLPLGGQGHLRLGPSPNDESHQWIFRVPNETANGLFIESAQVLDLFATRILGSSESIWLTRQPGVQEYFMVATNASSYYRICQDPGCSSLWVPYYHALGEPRDDLNELAIVRPSTPSPGAENEIWEITPAGGSSPPSSPTSSSSTTSASATPDSPPSSTYQTTFTQGDPPSQTSQVTEPGGLQVLKNCAPCGKAKCSFSSSGPAKKATYSILVGQPVSNCHNKSLETTTTKLGGTFELQETFNVEATVSAGLGFLGPSISTTVGHSTSKKIAQTQEIEVSIRPGQVVRTPFL